MKISPTYEYILVVRLVKVNTKYKASSLVNKDNLNSYNMLSFIHQSTRRMLQAGTLKRYLSCYINHKKVSQDPNLSTFVSSDENQSMRLD
jgi:hypothetical protein